MSLTKQRLLEEHMVEERGPTGFRFLQAPPKQLLLRNLMRVSLPVKKKKKKYKDQMLAFLRGKLHSWSNSTVEVVTVKQEEKRICERWGQLWWSKFLSILRRCNVSNTIPELGDGRPLEHQRWWMPRAWTALMDLDFLPQVRWLHCWLAIFLIVKCEGKMEQGDWEYSVWGTLLPYTWCFLRWGGGSSERMKRLCFSPAHI